ncbi:MAG: ACT domain-containing protein [Halobacteriota archaeon]
MADDERTERIIITVTGSDHPGIVAAIAKLLADANANIEDISQTVVSGLFTMIMIASIGSASFDALRQNLELVGKREGVQVTAQHENIFRYMHRI